MKKASENFSRLAAFTLTIVGTLVCLSDSAFAASAIFNVSSGSWNDASHWTTGTIPTSADTAFIRGGRTANILTDVGTINILNIVNQAGSGTVNIEAGGVLAVNNGAGNAVVIGNTASGTGVLNINAGLLSVTGATLVGSPASSVGTLTLSSGTYSGQAVRVGVSAGAIGTVNVTGGFFGAAATTVGDGGEGTFNLSTGTASITALTVGNSAGSNGTVTISSGLLEASDATIVGSSGSGNLQIDGGATSLQALTVGSLAGGQGSVTVSSGVLTSGTTVIGSSGNASMTVSGGTVAVSTFTVSSQNGSTGSLVIEGGQFTGTTVGNYFLGARVNSGTTNATFTQTGGSFQLGDSTGNGTLIIGSANGETQMVHGNATISGGTFTAKMIIGGGIGLGDGVLTVIGDDATIGSTATGTVLDLRATGAITFQLDATGISTLDYALGTVAFDNGFTLNIDGTNYAGGVQTFTLIDAGAFTNGNLANLNVNIYGFSAMYGSPALEFSGSDLNLVIAVPEPSTWMLFGLGLGALLWRTRIRRRIS